MLPFLKDVYPSGRYVIIKEAADGVFSFLHKLLHEHQETFDPSKAVLIPKCWNTKYLIIQILGNRKQICPQQVLCQGKGFNISTKSISKRLRPNFPYLSFLFKFSVLIA